MKPETCREKHTVGPVFATAHPIHVTLIIDVIALFGVGVGRSANAPPKAKALFLDPSARPVPLLGWVWRLRML